MAIITPGVDFILSTLAKLSLPPLFLSAAAYSLTNHFDHPVPTWVFFVFSLLAVPLPPLARIIYRRLYNRYHAAKLGARLVPEMEGRWIGNFDVIKRLNDMYEYEYPADGLLEFHDKLGPVLNMRVGWSDLIFTTSPDYIQRMLATEFTNFLKAGSFREAAYPVLGDGIFNSDGEMWKFHRSMTRTFFTRDRIADFDVFDEHANSVISKMKERLRSEHPVDFQDLMQRFTLDSATDFLFGACVHSLSGRLPYPFNVQVPESAQVSNANPESDGDAFAHGFHLAQELLVARGRVGSIWPLWEVFKDRTKEPMKLVRGYLDPIIEKAVSRQREAGPGADIKEKTEDTEESETLLDHMAKSTSDSVMIRHEVLNIMMAGRDTTASTLTFMVYCLAMYPDVFKRLREEILEQVGPTSRPTYDDIKDMKYLRAVIKETLRLFPPVPFNMRQIIKNTVWPSPDPSQAPLYIPAGTQVVYSTFLMHRRKDIWGPDAEEFDPNRFLDDRLKTYLFKNLFSYIPFNAGPRICLGQQFAYNEMSFMIIRLLQQFSSISLDLDAWPPEARPRAEWKHGEGRKTTEQVYPKVHTTMYTVGGLWVKMQEAENAS